MAEHEYYEVNGRQIRVRPTESGQEIDEYGNFHRQPNHFTKGFGEGENPVEADRYILFWGKGCNWSNRASIARELLGLDKAIKVEIVDWGDYEKPLGWEFVNSPDHINKETGAQFLSELYYKIAPLIELGAGFDGDLTGEENVYLNGALLGYSQSEMKKNYRDIVEFSELENFMNVPVKNYSSGMLSRLAFAIATIGIPDILIVDEVLSVGDFRFQKKCEDRIKKMQESGTTVLFVSHSIEQVKKICNKIVWLDHGKVRMYGNTREVCEEYEKI